MDNRNHHQTHFRKIVEDLSYRDCISMRKLIRKTCMVGKATVSNWETVKSRPSEENACAIASLLGFPVDEVFPKP